MSFVDVPGAVDDETELFLAWLAFLRAAVLRDLDGLDEEQARWRPDDHLIAVLGVVNHLAHVERRWIEGAFLGGERVRREAEFHVDWGVSVAEVVERYRAAAAHTEAVARSVSLDTPCRDAMEQGRNLRWVLMHLVQETARHAGHADATRELLDGTVGE